MQTEPEKLKELADFLFYTVQYSGERDRHEKKQQHSL